MNLPHLVTPRGAVEDLLGWFLRVLELLREFLLQFGDGISYSEHLYVIALYETHAVHVPEHLRTIC